MTLEEAIKTAIEYETKVRDLYIDAVNQSAESVGKSLFRLMADEEQYHVDYLVSRLNEWKENGKISRESVKTAVPSDERIAAGLSRLDERMDADASGAELDFLRKALEVERVTSDFYSDVVDDLGEEGREMFARFLEIERGHLALVQAQIDALSGTGYWFDVQEFNLEGWG